MAMYASTLNKLSSLFFKFNANSNEEAEVTANKVIFQILNDILPKIILVDGQEVKVETGIVDIVGETFIDPIE